MAAGIHHSTLFPPPFPSSALARPRSLPPSLSFDTCLLIKSMACALSCSALCKSARMRVSATFSTERLLHRASSHMTFKRSRAYWMGGGVNGSGKEGGTHKRHWLTPWMHQRIPAVGGFLSLAASRSVFSEAATWFRPAGL